MIGIVDKPGTFSTRWIQLLSSRGIPWAPVDVWRNDIIAQLRKCDALMWHVEHASPSEALAAMHILYACRTMGVKTFPSLETIWTFDNKLSQKYVLESAGDKLVPTYVFYDLSSAKAWIEHAAFPKVFKLKCGAGSRNVRLVRTRDEAHRIAKKAFNGGFVAYGGNAADAVQKAMSGQTNLQACLAKAMRAPRTLTKLWRLRREAAREKGYVYFQDFVPGNEHDTRVTVIGDKAFAFRRRVRPRDFRASGSGNIDYDQSAIDDQSVRIAFDVADRLATQSLCFDFVHLPSGEPRIIEISYVYVPDCVFATGGYWTKELRFVREAKWPQDVILDDFLESLNVRQAGDGSVFDESWCR
jgi:glutathione synthase/RimK-type ligase-like ATP-grasp enzyme